MIYRKRPVLVEAVQRHHPGDHPAVAPVLGTDPVCGVIQTLEGRMRVSPGDWIIIGVDGECYPCKPSIFDRTYERVQGGTPVRSLT